MENERFAALPLRVQKRARTRLALVEALAESLAEHSLDDVPVSALCKAAGISQATFFNYFPNKPALLTYFIQLWSLRVSALADDIISQHDSALRAIEALFASTADQSSQNPNIMLEIIAHQARATVGKHHAPIEQADRLLFLPEVEDVMALSDGGFGAVLPVLLALAVERGELPTGADVQILTLALANTFFGVPLVLGRSQAALVGGAYHQQLQLIWRAARGVS